MTQFNFAPEFRTISIDEPYYNSNAIINLLKDEEQIVASVTVEADKDVNAFWLMGEIGWRLLPITSTGATGRIRAEIKKNGVPIYRKDLDALVPDGSTCGRSSVDFMHIDTNPGEGAVRYDLIVSHISSDNVDLFRVTGPIMLFAGGLEKYKLRNHFT